MSKVTRDFLIGVCLFLTAILHVFGPGDKKTKFLERGQVESLHGSRVFQEKKGKKGGDCFT